MTPFEREWSKALQDALLYGMGLVSVRSNCGAQHVPIDQWPDIAAMAEYIKANNVLIERPTE